MVDPCVWKSLARDICTNSRAYDGGVCANFLRFHEHHSHRKAKVHLLVHETTGGMSPFAARRLRRLARAATENDADTTDYTLSSTARAFVPYYSQRICTAIRRHGAQGIVKRISRAR